MGFYGNITNTSNTTFSFDRIYPNRLAMDANVNNDSIFIGRYVLVEYQEKAAYPVAYHATLVDGSNTQYYFYSSTNGEEISKIKYLGPAPNEPEHLPSVDDVNAVYQDGFYENEILQYYIYSSEKKDWIFSEEFYICVGEIGGYAIFEKTTTPNMKSDYIQNFEIDENHYGQESKGFKGYDSTVWVKSSVEQNGKLITKYVNIADLNSVVPTFDIAADAPTMTPITPHFDADSTNVYYKLHMQSPYGFRVAKKLEDGISDANTVWYETTYDKTQDKTETRKVYEGPADIYYNEAGFNPDAPSVVSNTAEDNYIKLEPTASSGATYSHGAGANDIQEFRLHLPAIGNMMSKAWDIIHGPKRDNARTDDNSSLQGRLDSFRFMAGNQIPVKRANDGTLIGTNINGNNQCEVPEQGILDQSLTTSFDTDDAWIRTEINTNGLLDELGNEIGNNGISIHHTFHSKKDTETSANKNNSDGDGINKGIGNDLKLYTPIVDAAGHVVGKNTETVTLPYGYKSFTTEGLALDNEGKEIVKDLYTTINNQEDGNNTSSSSASTSESIANNTQDSIAIEPYNKWIQTQLNDDKLVIAHEIHAINTSSHGTTNENKEKDAINENNINIPDWDYDEAGHIKEKHDHYYTFPFGYKTIKVKNSDSSDEPSAEININGQSANNTQDVLNINASNKWIKLDNSEGNTVKLGHSRPFSEKQIISPTNTTVTQFGDTFNLINLLVDEAGHVIQYHEDEIAITIPEGSIIHPNSTSSNSDIITALRFNSKTGEISYDKDNTSTLKLATNYTTNEISAGAISGGDTINTAFAKLEKQVIKEISDRNTAISSAISAIVDKDDDGTINKLAEVIDWINNNPSTATQMQTAIQNNTTAIGNEKTRAEGIEAGLQDQINALGTAAQKDTEYFATSTQGTTAETTAATVATYGDIVTYNAEDFVLKSEYNALLSDFNELKTLVEQLNNQINPPQQPDNSGENI